MSKINRNVKYTTKENILNLNQFLGATNRLAVHRDLSIINNFELKEPNRI